MVHPPCKGYRLVISAPALKSLQKLDRAAQRLVRLRLQDLVDGKQNINIKKLWLGESLYRLKAGDFRIIYELSHHEITVHVVEVGHRKDIYHKVGRRMWHVRGN